MSELDEAMKEYQEAQARVDAAHKSGVPYYEALPLIGAASKAYAKMWDTWRAEWLARERETAK